MGKLRGLLKCRTIFQAEQDFKCYVELLEACKFHTRKELFHDILDALSMKTLSWSMGKVSQP